MEKVIDFSGEPYFLAYQNVIYKGPYFHRNALELLFVVRGSVEIEIEGEFSSLKSGEFICINAGMTHTVRGDENSYIVSLYFDLRHYEKIHPYIRSINIYCKYIEDNTTDLERYHALRNYFIRLTIMEYLKMPMRCELGTELCDIMVDILIFHLFDETNKRKSLSDLKPSDKERILSIAQYIHENYDRRGFTLSELAHNEHLSATRLSHFWKDMMKVSFKETVNNARFMESKRLLMEGNLPINKIVEKCGYSDEKYLYKAIKKEFGTTPAEFRKKHKAVIDMPGNYTIKDLSDFKNEMIDYSSIFYYKIKDLSFLNDHPDKIEEENLNELYSVITTTNKKKANHEMVPQDRTVLSLGLNSGIRYVNNEFDVNWEYIYAIGQITILLFKDCSLALDIELMTADEWHKILKNITIKAYERWGKRFKSTCSLLVTYRGYENLQKARIFADEVTKQGHFVKAIPVLYL